MKTLSVAGTVLASLLAATVLTPVSAADMTHERALNAAREPHNWLLHYNNYQGHRFSQLKEINLDTVKNLKPVFSVALEGIEGAGYAQQVRQSRSDADRRGRHHVCPQRLGRRLCL